MRVVVGYTAVGSFEGEDAYVTSAFEAGNHRTNFGSEGFFLPAGEHAGASIYGNVFFFYVAVE